MFVSTSSSLCLCLSLHIVSLQWRLLLLVVKKMQSSPSLSNITIITKESFLYTYNYEPKISANSSRGPPKINPTCNSCMIFTSPMSGFNSWGCVCVFSFGTKLRVSSLSSQSQQFECPLCGRWVDGAVLGLTGVLQHTSSSGTRKNQTPTSPFFFFF